MTLNLEPVLDLEPIDDKGSKLDLEPIDESAKESITPSQDYGGAGTAPASEPYPAPPAWMDMPEAPPEVAQQARDAQETAGLAMTALSIPSKLDWSDEYTPEQKFTEQNRRRAVASIERDDLKEKLKTPSRLPQEPFNPTSALSPEYRATIQAEGRVRELDAQISALSESAKSPAVLDYEKRARDKEKEQMELEQMRERIKKEVYGEGPNPVFSTVLRTGGALAGQLGGAFAFFTGNKEDGSIAYNLANVEKSIRDATGVDESTAGRVAGAIGDTLGLIVGPTGKSGLARTAFGLSTAARAAAHAYGNALSSGETKEQAQKSALMTAVEMAAFLGLAHRAKAGITSITGSLKPTAAPAALAVEETLKSGVANMAASGALRFAHGEGFAPTLESAVTDWTFAAHGGMNAFGQRRSSIAAVAKADAMRGTLFPEGATEVKTRDSVVHTATTSELFSALVNRQSELANKPTRTKAEEKELKELDAVDGDHLAIKKILDAKAKEAGIQRVRDTDRTEFEQAIKEKIEELKSSELDGQEERLLETLESQPIEAIATMYGKRLSEPVSSQAGMQQQPINVNVTPAPAPAKAEPAPSSLQDLVTERNKLVVQELPKYGENTDGQRAVQERIFALDRLIKVKQQQANENLVVSETPKPLATPDAAETARILAEDAAKQKSASPAPENLPPKVETAIREGTATPDQLQSATEQPLLFDTPKQKRDAFVLRDALRQKIEEIEAGEYSEQQDRNHARLTEMLGKVEKQIADNAKPAEPTPEKPEEHVSGVAVKDREGNVRTGQIHSMIEGFGEDGSQDGYVTNTGRFVTRKEAESLPRKSIKVNPRSDITPEEMQDPFRRLSMLEAELKSSRDPVETESINSQIDAANAEISQMGYTKKGDIWYPPKPTAEKPASPAKAEPAPVAKDEPAKAEEQKFRYYAEVKKSQMPLIEDAETGIKKRYEDAVGKKLTGDEVFNLATRIADSIESTGKKSPHIQDLLDSATDQQIKRAYESLNKQAEPAPVLRKGENQGDLLKGRSDDAFNLVGEKQAEPKPAEPAGPTKEKLADAAMRAYGSYERAIESLKVQAEADISAESKQRVKITINELERRRDNELRAEMEKEQMDAVREQEDSGGNELLSVLRKLGGLPLIGKETVLGGEFKRVFEMARGKHLRMKWTSKMQGKSLDAIRQELEGHGFYFETPVEMLEAIGRAMRGERIVGSEKPMEGGQEDFFNRQSISDKAPASPMHVNAVQRIATTLIARFKGAAKTTVVADGGQLPEAVKAKAREQGIALNRIGGAVHDGKVYLNAAGLESPKRAAEIFFHEQAGHMGVDGLLDGLSPKSSSRLMDALRREFPAESKYAEKWYEPNEHLSEALARIMEKFGPESDATPQAQSRYRRVVDFIRTILAKSGIKNWSKNDIEALLRRGIEKVRRGEGKADKGDTRLSIEDEKRVTPKQDAAYAKAVEKGDTETAQRMVDEAAKKAGYSVKASHWTDSSFSVFDGSKNATAQGATTQMPGHWFTGGDFTHTPFGKNKISAYLKLENPKVFKSAEDYIYDSKRANNPDAYRANLVNKGHDGAIIKPSKEWAGSQEWDHTNYVVFEPNQIKSADPITRDASGKVIPLSERFNPKSDDIRFAINDEPGGRSAWEAKRDAFRKSKEKAKEDDLFAAAPKAEPILMSSKNAFQAEEARKRGESPIESDFYRSNPEVAEAARVAMDKNPDTVDTVIRHLLEEGRDTRKISIQEEAMLVHRGFDLKRQIAGAERMIENKNSTPAQKAMAEDSIIDAQTKMIELATAMHASGEVWGAFGSFRQRIFQDDFSPAAMVRKVEKAKGKKLTDAEIEEIEIEAKSIEKTRADREKAEMDAEGIQRDDAAQDAFDNALKYHPKVLVWADEFVNRAVARGDAALARFKRKLTGTANISVDPTMIADLAQYAFGKIAGGSRDFVKFSAEVISEVGEDARKFLKPAWDKAQKMFGKSSIAKTKEKTPKQLEREATAKDEAESIEDGIKAVAKDPKALNDGFDSYVKKLANEYVRMGETTVAGVIAKLHKFFDPFMPDLTDNALKDAWTDYGKGKEATTDPTKRLQQQIRAEALLERQISDAEAALARSEAGEDVGNYLKLTGNQRVPLREQARLLRAQLGELKKKIPTPDITAGARRQSSLDAMETRARNRIAELRYEIAKGERTLKQKSLPPTSPKLEALRAELEEVQAEHLSVFGKRQMTEEQKLKLAIRSAESSEKKAIAELVNARKGIFAQPATKGVSRFVEVEAIRKRAEAARAETKALKGMDTAIQEAKKVESLESQIEKLESTLAEGKFAPKEKESDPTVETEAVTNLQAKRDALAAELAEKRKAARPVPDAELRELNRLESELASLMVGRAKPQKKMTVDTEQQAFAREQLAAKRAELAEIRANDDMHKIANRKAAILRQMADLADRTARGDFEPRKKKPALDISKDPDTMRLAAELTKKKADFARRVEKYRLANLTSVQRGLINLGKTWDSTRNLFLSFDFSAFLQTAAAAAAHPLEAGKALGKGVKAFAFTLFSDRYAHELQERARQEPLYKNGTFKKMGLEISETMGEAREENMTNVLERLADVQTRWKDMPEAVKKLIGMRGVRNIISGPFDITKLAAKGLGRGLKGSNVAFGAIAGHMRLVVAKSLLRRWFPDGNATDAQLKLLGKLANTFSGKGGIKNGGALNRLFFAPNYYLSIMKGLSGWDMREAAFAGEGKVTAAMAEEYVRAIATIVTVGSIAYLLGDRDEQDINPLDSDFGKFVGKHGTRTDLSMGRGAYVTQAARYLTGYTKEDGKYVKRDRNTGLALFLAGRFSREIKMATAILDGKSYDKKLEGPLDYLKESSVPLAWRDFDKVLEKEGITRGAFLQMLNLIGVTSRIEDEKKSSGSIDNMARKMKQEIIGEIGLGKGSILRKKVD